MKLKLLLYLLSICYLQLSCNSTKRIKNKDTISKITPDSLQTTPPISVITKTDPFLEDILRSDKSYLRGILSNRDKLKIQIIYTQIDRQADNTPVFKNYYFNVNPTVYFYPASTVKLPVALLALQRLNELKVYGLNSQATMLTEQSYHGQTAVFNDPTCEDGRPTIANYIKKIFLVSDNDAFNRLYEFLGQEYINYQLHKKGYPYAEIIHRLQIFLSEEENRRTNAVRFMSPDGVHIYEQPMHFNSQPHLKRNDFLAKSYYDNRGDLVHEPMNFSKKNRLALEDLHNMLRSVLFPESVPATQRFNLNAEDYRFVWKYMSQFPPESKFPEYDSSRYWDAYGKLIFYGSEKGTLPKDFRIFNKEGDAYGCLTDVAYIADFDNKIEFMLSATIYCNSDGVMNDDFYDYDTVGLPFMKHLGQVLYDYEQKRARKYKPDLSKFKMEYDK
jgi:beta-lactamase class A